MSEPYLGQIELFAFNLVPKGWAACQGQLLSIQQNAALFSVLGTTYGGDGIRTFALPDLRGRVAMGQGSGGGVSPVVMGQTQGEANHTLLITEIPAHSHALHTAPSGAIQNNSATPNSSMVLGNATGKQGSGTFTLSPYAAVPPAPSVPMAGTAITPGVGGQPHSNMMPYLGLGFCIALSGIFPTQN
jgi:microcystin-dependent protein